MEKLTIEIPISLYGEISKQHVQELVESMNNDYDYKYNFIANLDSDTYIYNKYDDDRKAYIIFFDVTGYTRVKAQQIIWDKMELLKGVKSEMIFVVSDEDVVVSLSKNEDLSEIENITNSEKYKNIK